MKPVGLVTCYFHHNYGSMLQAYATEMIMQQMGLPYQTIACKSPIVYMEGNKLIYFCKKILIGDWKLKLGKIKIEQAKRKHPEFKRNWNVRDACFTDFASRYFHISPYCRNREELKRMSLNYSAFLVGSDQLWRTDSVEHGYYTLEWVDDSIRKISYSTSIGIKKIPWFQIKKNRCFMNRFDYIAMREQSACELVYKLTGRRVPVVLDPTLLFTGAQWMHIQQKQSIIQNKYIFCYLLGNNPWQRELIRQVRDTTGIKIVALQHIDDYIANDEGFADEAPYNIGPCEFLNLIRNAEYVFTDSFHCSVFSILYKKNFFTFNRFDKNALQNTNTRIDNLLCLTGLYERRIIKSITVEKIITFAQGFDRVDEKLGELRKLSLNYLANSLADLEVL